ncbi:hypothetical protein [Corynebacterium glyciniphilum]|uniref:hypothetical protein n=1 Tax=Corynebacterium glyciniphilum TaxID=1404244 RepID=UPI00264A668A|nr:hypothetical protein [Corynebacterium glyciniphilum]MDN6706408.1 hypothetical protein [Corynebacterium glyciniphilum]
MNSNTQKNLAPAATGDQANEKLPTAISNTDDTAPRYYRHTRVREVNDIGYSLCGHTRPLAEAKRIIAELGAAWETTPPCPDCVEIKRMQAAAVRRRERAEMIAEFVLRTLEEKEES